MASDYTDKVASGNSRGLVVRVDYKVRRVIRKGVKCSRNEPRRHHEHHENTTLCSWCRRGSPFFLSNFAVLLAWLSPKGLLS